MNQRTPESARATHAYPQPLTVQEHKPKGGRPKTFIHDHFIQDGVYNEKAKRTGVSCRYCTYKTANSKVAVLIHHILESCPSVSRPVKEDVAERAIALQAKQAQDAATAGVPKTGKRKAAAKGSLDSKSEETLDLRAVRFIVLCGCSFSILDSPWFYDFVTTLRPNYKPPGTILVILQVDLVIFQQLVKLTQKLTGSFHSGATSQSKMLCMSAQLSELFWVIGIAQLPGLLLQEYKNVIDRVTKLLASASGITVVFDRRLHTPSKATYHTTCVTEHGDVLPGPWKETASETFDAALVAGEHLLSPHWCTNSVLCSTIVQFGLLQSRKLP